MFKEINLPLAVKEAVETAYEIRPQFCERQAKRAYDGQAPDYPIMNRRPLGGW